MIYDQNLATVFISDVSQFNNFLGTGRYYQAWKKAQAIATYTGCKPAQDLISKTEKKYNVMRELMFISQKRGDIMDMDNLDMNQIMPNGHSKTNQQILDSFKEIYDTMFDSITQCQVMLLEQNTPFGSVDLSKILTASMDKL